MFNYLKDKLIILYSVGLALFFITPTFATEIAFVKGQYVFENVVAWKNFKDEIKLHSNKVKDIVIKQEADVEQIWFKINELRDEGANANEIIELEEQFKQKSEKLQSYVQIQKKQMDSLYLEQQDIVKSKISDIISGVAKQKKIDLVINISHISLNSVLAYGRDKNNITEKVLKMANKQIKKIDVNLNYKKGM